MTRRPVLVETPVQEIQLPVVPAGRVLDIGGGGEGLVSRIAESRACVVDLSMNKIREAQMYEADAEWFACDGRSLCFQAEAFDTATLWFSLSYLHDRYQKQLIIREIHRVLRSTGKVSILAILLDESCEALTFRGQLRFPDGYVSQMSYRVRGDQLQNCDAVREMLTKDGFEVVTSTEHVHWFEMLAAKA
jgi:ubiquinone/menaquinone biosynthesis C-methylase UbiE